MGDHPGLPRRRSRLLPWSPLGGGWLTGKYQPDVRPAGTTRLGEDPERGIEAYSARSTVERTWTVIDAVRHIAAQRGATMAQIALAWLMAQPSVASVILGARTRAQLEDNLGAGGIHLTAPEMQELEAASDPGAPPYPYGPAGIGQRSRTAAPRLRRPRNAAGTRPSRMLMNRFATHPAGAWRAQQ